ncbi:MAG: HNH endonuclease [Candidatus Brocadiales bacterium]|nr:HNH endonuclease [Candidatus Bathyanammoxibius sp.]
MGQMRKPWTENELLAAFRLYCRIPFGRLHQTHPEIVQLAEAMSRTPSAVSMKACNFASLDPELQRRGIAGLTNIGKADKLLWERFQENSEQVAEEAEMAWEYSLASAGKATDEVPKVNTEETERETTLKTRRVQGFFRSAVLISYDYRCAFTGLAIPGLLNASHIIPWSVSESRRADPTNGICLNALHDRAFDRGLITIDEEYRIVVSPSLQAMDSPFHQQAFVKIAGKKIHLPRRFLPDQAALVYHRESVFVSGK